MELSPLKSCQPPCLTLSKGLCFIRPHGTALRGGARGARGAEGLSSVCTSSLLQAGDDAFALPDLLGAFHPLWDGDRAGLQVRPLPSPPPTPGPLGPFEGGGREGGKGWVSEVQDARAPGTSPTFSSPAIRVTRGICLPPRRRTLPPRARRMTWASPKKTGVCLGWDIVLY